MKVVAVNGSARREGNTAMLLDVVLGELEKEDIDTEVVSLAGSDIRGCTACYRCYDHRDRRCVIDDVVNECIAMMLEADGVILASPTYFANVSPELKALIDRAGMVARANDHMFQGKVGAAVVAVRRAGALPVFDAINHFFLISQMIVPGSSYWNLGVGRTPGDVADDAEGMETMRTLGANMAWLLHRLHGR
ncbi:MAG: flavodoxin family protein [Thermoplasmatota archaeon]